MYIDLYYRYIYIYIIYIIYIYWDLYYIYIYIDLYYIYIDLYTCITHVYMIPIAAVLRLWSTEAPAPIWARWARWPCTRGHQRCIHLQLPSANSAGIFIVFLDDSWIFTDFHANSAFKLRNRPSVNRQYYPWIQYIHEIWIVNMNHQKCIVNILWFSLFVGIFRIDNPWISINHPEKSSNDFQSWLVVGPPLWKRLEFVNWDDESNPIYGKIKLMATKPPTRNHFENNLQTSKTITLVKLVAWLQHKKNSLVVADPRWSSLILSCEIRSWYRLDSINPVILIVGGSWTTSRTNEMGDPQGELPNNEKSNLGWAQHLPVLNKVQATSKMW